MRVSTTHLALEARLVRYWGETIATDIKESVEKGLPSKVVIILKSETTHTHTHLSLIHI